MKRNRHSAYALLLVLVTLTLTSVALTQMASRTLRGHADSLAKLRSLQSRWGRISCERAVLHEAAKIFDSLQTTQRLTGATESFALKETISLGSQEFTIILADENAKANLNSLAQHGRTGAVPTALRNLLNPNPFRALRNLDSEKRFRSWGEVFELTRLRELEGSERVLAEVTRELTLWGTGHTNIHRASDKVLESVAKSIVTDGLARRIVERNREASDLECRLLLQQTVLNESDRKKLELVLGDGSSTFSVWVESFDGIVTKQHFSVSYTDDDGRRLTDGFMLN